jgi:general secretion pathway protein A
MYKNFFGFRERPFKLVPNPAYLFLSRTHEEAMAHLTYALSQGDGFIELTGEVGTGKTTICRTFLENLDNRTEAAYIFNPKLDSLQLLRTINQEFGISAAADNSKDLVDQLNEFLLRKKAEGKKVILVIDEAQNLNMDVLEQLRLLSNLETTTSKLLQIVLVGQPELGEMLDSPELRQLSQRITLSCHLHPLSSKETREYIRHRIHVASQKQEAGFTRAAIRMIYRYSGGIPRLINIACDRALLTAFGLNRKKVTGSIARSSVKELSSRGRTRHLGYGKGLLVSFTLLCAGLLAFFLLAERTPIQSFFNSGNAPLPPAIVQQPSEEKSAAVESLSPAPAEVRIPTEAPVPTPIAEEGSKLIDEEGLKTLLMGITRLESRSEAMKSALAMSHAPFEINPYLEGLQDDQTYFRLVAKQNGLMIHRLEGGWRVLEKLNIPAILELQMGDGEPRYLSLSHVEDGEISLGGLRHGNGVRILAADLWNYWSRVSYIFWKDFLNYPESIPIGASAESIIALKLLLQELGFKELEISPSYDEKSRSAVMALQEEHGIRADGIVGPLTKIVLYKEKRSLKIPRIKRQAKDSKK